jgi:hypothetical protein
MLIAGLVLLALAAVAAGVAYWQHRKHGELAAVEGSTCGALRQLADAVSVSAGGGVFRQRCELTGVARPAYVGTVSAPQTGREAVWYRTRVTHQYYDYEWDHDDDHGSRRRRVKKSRVLSDERSDAPFAVDDGTGQAVIHPERADIDAPVQVLDQLDRELEAAGGLLDRLKSSAIGVDETIGYKREEWVIPVDARLFVQGEVTDEEGQLRLRAPEKGSFRVSTRSEEELLRSASTVRRWSAVAAGALAAIGLLLVVLGLVA